MVQHPANSLNRGGLLALLVVLHGCGGQATTQAPQPGSSRGTPPDLRGSGVLVLPVQQNAGVPGNPDAEIGFALTSRSTDVWRAR